MIIHVLRLINVKNVCHSQIIHKYNKNKNKIRLMQLLIQSTDRQQEIPTINRKIYFIEEKSEYNNNR